MSTPVSNAQTKSLEKPRPSDQFRAEHLEIKKHLAEIEDWVGNLSSISPAAQKEKFEKIISFFKEHIKPHAEWEEKKLYPAVDKRVGTNPTFTATMRYEHQIVGRWIGDLEKEYASKTPNVKTFSRKADQLLGLIKAHFEEEEEVLLPILDKSMTAEQFQKEILNEKSH